MEIGLIVLLGSLYYLCKHAKNSTGPTGPSGGLKAWREREEAEEEERKRAEAEEEEDQERDDWWEELNRMHRNR